MSTSETLVVTIDESCNRVELVLEAIAPRHQITVLRRSGTRRPCCQVRMPGPSYPARASPQGWHRAHGILRGSSFEDAQGCITNM
jgi:hypothetical protein